jgi:hypothetical protein
VRYWPRSIIGSAPSQVSNNPQAEDVGGESCPTVERNSFRSCRRETEQMLFHDSGPSTVFAPSFINIPMTALEGLRPVDQIARVL